MPDIVERDATEKKPTNVVFLIIFLISTILYIGIAAYAFIASTDINLDFGLFLTKFPIGVLGKSKLGTFFEWLIVQILLTPLCILISRLMSKFILSICLLEICIFVISIITHFIFEEKISYLYLICMFFTTYIAIVGAYSILRLKSRPLKEVIKESCRAIFAFPYALALPILKQILASLIIVLNANIPLHLMAIDTISDLWTSILCWMIVLSGSWLALSLLFFVFMVFCNIYATWYYAMDKSALPKNTTWRCITSIFRYHLGTVACAASPYAPFVIIYAMIKNLKSVARDAPYNIFIMIPCWFVIFIKLFVDSAGISTIYGLSFEKSADSISKLYLKHPYRLLGIMQAFDSCIFASFTTGGTIIGLIILCSGIDVSAIDNITASMLILVILGPFLLIFYVSVSTITFCMFEDFDKSSGAFTKNELKEIMESQ